MLYYLKFHCKKKIWDPCSRIEKKGLLQIVQYEDFTFKNIYLRNIIEGMNSDT